jgi:DNA-binding MarR family transcriptional regulator
MPAGKKPLGLAKKLEPLDVCACSNLRKATRAITQLYDEALRPAGLRATQLSLLTACGNLEPVTVGYLAHAVVMDRTTLARDLKPLEREGLIKIATGQDQRERRITLTARGHRALARAFPLWEKAQADVVQGIGSERLQRLLSDLSAMVTAVR